MNILFILLILLNTNKSVIDYQKYEENLMNSMKKSKNNTNLIECYEKSKTVLSKIFSKDVKYKCGKNSYFKDYSDFITYLCSNELMSDMLDGDYQKCNENEYKSFIKKYDAINKYKENNEMLKTAGFCYSVFDVIIDIDDFHKISTIEIFINLKTNKLLFYHEANY